MKTVTLQNAYTIFTRQYSNPATRRAYDNTMLEFIRKVGADRPITEITPFDMLDWSADIRAPQRNLAEATIYRHIKHVKAFFNWAHRIEVITSNPAKVIKQIRVTKTRAESQLMPKSDLQTLCSYLREENDLRGYALVLFLADTGCRRGGAAGLKVRDVHLRSRTAQVFEKDKNTRQVFYGRACARALDDWLKSRGPIDLEHYVFSRHGEPISASALAQFFRRRAINAGIGSKGPHRLRRQKIVGLLEERVNPVHVQNLVGHKNIETTLKYVPRDMAAVRRIADEYAVSEAEDATPSKIIKFKS